MKILAVDPSIRHTGYAVLSGDHKNITVHDYGVISLDPKIAHSLCLLATKDHLSNLIKKWQPDEFAIERIIFVQSHQTAIYMGSARAAALIAAAEFGLPSYEYSPKSVKLAATGKGAAKKEQVAYMMRMLLGLRENPPHDAADALAIAFTHLNCSDPFKSRIIERKQV